MDQQTTKGALIGALGTAACLIGGYLLSDGSKATKANGEPVIPRAQTEETKGGEGQGASKISSILLGDVGGTNIRLILKQVDLSNSEKPGKVLKDGRTLSQQVKSFEEAVELFLEASLFPI